ncbi:hypothetical protein LZ30DRAFT_214332 [Colletotrichum cereale]|nr:hypothetical protein LZ30DRAFT_214332 [Colletotrichum cereale]
MFARSQDPFVENDYMEGSILRHLGKTFQVSSTVSTGCIRDIPNSNGQPLMILRIRGHDISILGNEHIYDKSEVVGISAQDTRVAPRRDCSFAVSFSAQYKPLTGPWTHVEICWQYLKPRNMPLPRSESPDSAPKGMGRNHRRTRPAKESHAPFCFESIHTVLKGMSNALLRSHGGHDFLSVLGIIVRLSNRKCTRHPTQLSTLISAIITVDTSI